MNTKQNRQRTYSVTLRRFLATILVVEGNKYYTMCVRVGGALVIQHVMRMRHIVICELPRSTLFFHINT